jgi:hypothetical protein
MLRFCRQNRGMATDDDDNLTQDRLLGLPVLVKAQTAPVGNGSMADLGEEYTISTIPAFTEAAANETDAQPSDTETGTPSLEMKKALRPAGQGGLKLG